jgi:hypothetical protein
MDDEGIWPEEQEVRFQGAYIPANKIKAVLVNRPLQRIEKDEWAFLDVPVFYRTAEDAWTALVQAKGASMIRTAEYL